MIYLYKITTKGLVYAGPGVPAQVEAYGAQGYCTSRFRLH